MTVLAWFAAHVLIRFAGLWTAAMVPLSMLLVWPMPWVVSDRADRRAIGFRVPAWHWLPLGGVLGLGSVGICAAMAWGIFGDGPDNWFARHALALDEAAAGIPAEASPSQRFWFLTIPAMIFSPIAEEILFRGYLMRAWSSVARPNRGVTLQAVAFALVHLAHYGLRPFQPALIPLWLVSMFAVAWMLGWLVTRSGSLWPAMLAHAVFNLLLNLASFTMFMTE